MKVICKSKKLLQDKLKPEIYYEYNKVYEVDDETGKRLIASKKFEKVIEETKEKVNKKEGK